jgi:tetratricopeptide (TPR) repeat protein
MAAAAFLIAASSLPARAQSPWEACAAAPSRACVLDLAAADIAATEDPIRRAAQLADLGLARSRAGLATAAEGDFAAATQALQNDDASLPSHALRPWAQAELATTLADAGRIDEAVRAADEIAAEDALAARAGAAIAVAQAKAGRGDAATQSVASALAHVRGMKFPNGKFGALRAVYAAQRATGLAADAARTLESEREAALAEPDEAMRNGDLMAIARDEAMAGDIAAALQGAAQVSEPMREAATLNVFRAALEAGKRDEAAAIIPTLSRILRARASLDIAESLAKAGDKPGESEALANAGQMLATLPEGAGKALGLMTLAGFELKVGAEPASADIALARKIFDGLPGNVRDQATPAFASALARAGLTREALALAGTTPPGVARDMTYRLVSGAQGAAGDFAGALRALQQVEARDFRAGALEELAAAMGK